MKYALVNGQRKEPQPELQGICPCCGGKLNSRCGEERVWHWYHLRKIDCDPWWENETEWHRNWKNKFPVEWQEIIQKDENTGEKHIADIRTGNDWVIEFQHSSIKIDERVSREGTYKKLVWVVDGKRRKLDAKQFYKSIDGRHCLVDKPLIVGVFKDDSRIIREWSSSKVPVFFDFGESDLWLLLGNNRAGELLYIVRFLKAEFLNFLHDTKEEDVFLEMINGLNKLLVDRLKLQKVMREVSQMQRYPTPRQSAYQRRQMRSKGRL